jgi:hypothetical protein
VGDEAGCVVSWEDDGRGLKQRAVGGLVVVVL